MSLKNLIALQQKKAETNVRPSTPSTVRNEVPESKSEGPVSDAPKSEQLPSDDSSAPTPAPEAAPKKSGLGLNLVGRGPKVGAPANRAVPRSVDKGHGATGDSRADAGKDDGAGFSLEDLAGFDATDESAPAKSIATSGFDDEIEATAPERALEPDLTVQQLGFVEALDGIYPVLHDPELFGQAVRTIMLELQDNPEYKKLLSDQDVHTMIRGMRNTMGLARIRKMEKSRKAGSKGKASARSKSSVSDEDMALLESVLGGSLD